MKRIFFVSIYRELEESKQLDQAVTSFFKKKKRKKRTQYENNI